MADFDTPRNDAGDERLDLQQRGGARMPGTPGYESEAAYRHRNSAEADLPELNANQLAPFPLQEATEENTRELSEGNPISFRQDDRHQKG
jgi:hypothetical protein